MALAGPLGRGLGLDLGLARLAVLGELVGTRRGDEVEILNGDVELILRELLGDNLAVGLLYLLARLSFE